MYNTDTTEATEHSLAYELLVEVKRSARRWFVAFCIVVILEILTIAGFMWYMSLPSEEYGVEQTTDAGGDNYNIGGNYNGTTEDNIQEKNSKK